MIYKKLNLLLKKPFWGYKEIAEFYEVSYSKAIKIKKETEHLLLEDANKGRNKRGINRFNGDLINSDAILKRISNKNRIEKINEFLKLLEIYEGKGKGVGIE